MNLANYFRGRLIVCTSSCVRFASPGLGPYTASKWALSGYSETIRYLKYILYIFILKP